jgi:hypothetical protein
VNENSDQRRAIKIRTDAALTELAKGEVNQDAAAA